MLSLLVWLFVARLLFVVCRYGLCVVVARCRLRVVVVVRDCCLSSFVIVCVVRCRCLCCR